MQCREEGVANLSTDCDYSYLAERVNAKRFAYACRNCLAYHNFLQCSRFNYLLVKIYLYRLCFAVRLNRSFFQNAPAQLSYLDYRIADFVSLVFLHQIVNKLPQPVGLQLTH